MTLVVGFCAHPCHLATAMIVLGALTRWRGHPTDSRFVWAMLGAELLQLRREIIESRDPRDDSDPFPN